MDGWLIRWMPGGRNRIDQVVTILPAAYTVDDVALVLRALFFVGTFEFSDTLTHLRGNQVTPHVQRTRYANGYAILRIEFGSDVMEASLARQITVTTDEERHETIRWQVQTHKGEWVDRRFTRTHVGTITFDSE